jgi:hypothetical protein
MRSRAFNFSRETQGDRMFTEKKVTPQNLEFLEAVSTQTPRARRPKTLAFLDSEKHQDLSDSSLGQIMGSLPSLWDKKRISEHGLRKRVEEAVKNVIPDRDFQHHINFSVIAIGIIVAHINSR